MAGKLCFGAIVKWCDFEFDDGETSDKLLVILGCKRGHEIIGVLATSKPRGRPKVAGCQPDHQSGAFYYMQGGMKNCFRMDTWVELYRPQEIDPEIFYEQMDKGTIHVVFNLDPGVAAGIRNCLKRTLDVTPHQITLLGRL